jgi:hypothetical protein
MPEELTSGSEPWMAEKATARAESRMSRKPAAASAELLRGCRTNQQGDDDDAGSAHRSDHCRRRHARLRSNATFGQSFLIPREYGVGESPGKRFVLRQPQKPRTC